MTQPLEGQYFADMRKLGENLRRLAESRGHRSPAELAADSGINYRTIVDWWFKYEAVPRGTTIEAFAAYFRERTGPLRKYLNTGDESGLRNPPSYQGRTIPGRQTDVVPWAFVTWAERQNLPASVALDRLFDWFLNELSDDEKQAVLRGRVDVDEVKAAELDAADVRESQRPHQGPRQNTRREPA